MSDEEIEANLLAILHSISKFDPRKRKAPGSGNFEWPFITHLVIESKPCPETYKLDHDALMVKAASSADSSAASAAAESSSDSESDDEQAKEEKVLV